jgi:hypothetical protein
VISGVAVLTKLSHRMPKFFVYHWVVLGILFTVSTKWSRDLMVAAVEVILAKLGGFKAILKTFILDLWNSRTKSWLSREWSKVTPLCQAVVADKSTPVTADGRHRGENKIFE